MPLSSTVRHSGRIYGGFPINVPMNAAGLPGAFPGRWARPSGAFFKTDSGVVFVSLRAWARQTCGQRCPEVAVCFPSRVGASLGLLILKILFQDFKFAELCARLGDGLRAGLLEDLPLPPWGDLIGFGLFYPPLAKFPRIVKRLPTPFPVCSMSAAACWGGYPLPVQRVDMRIAREFPNIL